MPTDFIKQLSAEVAPRRYAFFDSSNDEVVNQRMTKMSELAKIIAAKERGVIQEREMLGTLKEDLENLRRMYENPKNPKDIKLPKDVKDTLTDFATYRTNQDHLAELIQEASLWHKFLTAVPPPLIPPTPDWKSIITNLDELIKAALVGDVDKVKTLLNDDAETGLYKLTGATATGGALLRWKEIQKGMFEKLKVQPINIATYDALVVPETPAAMIDLFLNLSTRELSTKLDKLREFITNLSATNGNQNVKDLQKILDGPDGSISWSDVRVLLKKLEDATKMEAFKISQDPLFLAMTSLENALAKLNISKIGETTEDIADIYRKLEHVNETLAAAKEDASRNLDKAFKNFTNADLAKTNADEQVKEKDGLSSSQKQINASIASTKEFDNAVVAFEENFDKPTITITEKGDALETIVEKALSVFANTSNAIDKLTLSVPDEKKSALETITGIQEKFVGNATSLKATKDEFDRINAPSRTPIATDEDKSNAKAALETAIIARKREAEESVHALIHTFESNFARAENDLAKAQLQLTVTNANVEKANAQKVSAENRKNALDKASVSIDTLKTSLTSAAVFDLTEINKNVTAAITAVKAVAAIKSGVDGYEIIPESIKLIDLVLKLRGMQQGILKMKGGGRQVGGGDCDDMDDAEEKKECRYKELDVYVKFLKKFLKDDKIDTPTDANEKLVYEDLHKKFYPISPAATASATDPDSKVHQFKKTTAVNISLTMSITEEPPSHNKAENYKTKDNLFDINGSTESDIKAAKTSVTEYSDKIEGVSDAVRSALAKLTSKFSLEASLVKEVISNEILTQWREVTEQRQKIVEASKKLAPVKTRNGIDYVFTKTVTDRFGNTSALEEVDKNQVAKDFAMDKRKIQENQTAIEFINSESKKLHTRIENLLDETADKISVLMSKEKAKYLEEDALPDAGVVLSPGAASPGAPAASGLGKVAGVVPLITAMVQRLIKKGKKRTPEEEIKFVEELKANNLYPDDVLRVDARDKGIFIGITFVVRMIALYTVSSLVDRRKIKTVTAAMIWFFALYIGLLAAITLVVNLDTYRSRIMLNFFNLHINSSGLFTHAIVFAGAIFLVFQFMDVIKFPFTGLKMVAETDGDRAKLVYQLETLTFMSWMVTALATYAA